MSDDLRNKNQLKVNKSMELSNSNESSELQDDKLN